MRIYFVLPSLRTHFDADRGPSTICSSISSFVSPASWRPIVYSAPARVSLTINCFGRPQGGCFFRAPSTGLCCRAFSLLGAANVCFSFALISFFTGFLLIPVMPAKISVESFLVYRQLRHSKRFHIRAPELPELPPTGMTKGGQRRPVLVASLAALLVFVTLVYSNHFGNAFHFDDSHTIVQNPYIQRPSQ